MALLLVTGTSLQNPLTAPLRLNQLHYRGSTVSEVIKLVVLLEPGVRNYVWELGEQGAATGLTDLREWSLRHPNHLPIFVSFQPKDRTQLESLTAEILTVLERRNIVRSKDARLAAPSLRAAVLEKGWPEVFRLRGRFIFTLHDTGALREAYKNIA